MSVLPPPRRPSSSRSFLFLLPALLSVLPATAVIPAIVLPAVSVIPAKAGIYSHILSYKSNHSGLSFSINSIFHARFHFLSAFSLLMALSMVS